VGRSLLSSGCDAAGVEAECLCPVVPERPKMLCSLSVRGQVGVLPERPTDRPENPFFLPPAPVSRAAPAVPDRVSLLRGLVPLTSMGEPGSPCVREPRGSGGVGPGRGDLDRGGGAMKRVAPGARAGARSERGGSDDG
jgi:hypothetical protein